MTPAGAALLSIAVAAATGGTASSLTSGLTSSAAVNTALAAGIVSLSSQAAVAMVNNGGDIGKTLAQLGSEQSVKGLITAMVAAGALQSLDKALGFADKVNPGDFTGNLIKNVTNNVAGRAVDAAIQGRPFDENVLASAFTDAFISAGMAYGANAIGGARVDGNAATGTTNTLNDFTSKLAHAVLGCAAGAAQNGGCAAGAVGAVVGELTAEYAHNQGMNDADALDLAKVVAAASGVLTGGGGDNAQAVNVAANTGANAAENNYLAHSEAMVRAALRDKQAKGTLSPTEQQQLTNLEVLDIARDLALKDACNTPGDVCDAARRDLNAAIASYATAGGTNNARLSAVGNQSVEAELKQNVALANDPTLAQQTLWDSFKEFAVPQAVGYATGAVLGKFITEAQAIYAAIKAEATVVPGATVSGGLVADESAALHRMGGNSNGPVLNGKAPNTVLNQQAVNDLANGTLPGITKNPNTGLPDAIPRTGVPREMPSSLNPSAMAEDFALKALGREPTQAELSKGLTMNGGNCQGCWSAKSADGTYITYRPAGSASKNTLDMTASVDIDFKATGNAINGGKVVKLKFPQQESQ